MCVMKNIFKKIQNLFKKDKLSKISEGEETKAVLTRTVNFSYTIDYKYLTFSALKGYLNKNKLSKYDLFLGQKVKYVNPDTIDNPSKGRRVEWIDGNIMGLFIDHNAELKLILVPSITSNPLMNVLQGDYNRIDVIPVDANIEEQLLDKCPKLSNIESLLNIRDFCKGFCIQDCSNECPLYKFKKL